MLRIWATGSTRKTEAWLESLHARKLYSNLSDGGRRGVKALSSVTPKDSGTTAGSWNYTVEMGAESATITWSNSKNVAGKPLVIMLTYGHGTGTGGYVAGRDFINPAIQPVMDEIANDVWKKVTSG